MAQVIEPAEALFKQWLASLLLGALNIEQTKFLNWADLSRLLGTLVRFPHPPRLELERVATPANIAALLRFNARQIGADTQNQFYFDPHTKHDTGQENVLKGWCAAMRWADKALHSDFIHPVAGAPLYFETTANFADRVASREILPAQAVASSKFLPMSSPCLVENSTMGPCGNHGTEDYKGSAR